MHTPYLTHIALGAILITGMVGLSGCPDEDASSDSNNTSTQNPTTMEGSKETSSFDVEAKDSGSGMSEKVANEIPNEMASKATSGAAIAGSILNIYLVAPNGTAITAIVETSEMNKAPGAFAVGEPPEGSFVTWLAPASGQILNSKGGSIVLDGCPKAQGDKVVGSFDGVQLTDELSGATQTLTGKFDVSLYSVNGALLCTEKPVTDPDPDPNPNPAPTCDAEACDDSSGTCCPYAQCMFSCELRCLTQDPSCSNPLTADPVKCATCLGGCLDECNVSAECRSDHNALTTCEENAGCSDQGEEMTCTRENCCAEFDAAF